MGTPMHLCISNRIQIQRQLFSNNPTPLDRSTCGGLTKPQLQTHSGRRHDHLRISVAVLSLGK